MIPVSKHRQTQVCPVPPVNQQAHSSCLLALAISASPAPHHEPNLLWPAQLLTIPGAAARLDLLGCGLRRASWLLGLGWVAQDPCSPFRFSTSHQTLADSILHTQTKHQKKVMERCIPQHHYIVSEWHFPRIFLKVKDILQSICFMNQFFLFSFAAP